MSSAHRCGAAAAASRRPVALAAAGNDADARPGGGGAGATWSGGFGGSELFDEAFVLATDSMCKSSLLSRFHQFDDFVHVHIEKLVQLNSSVNLPSEGLFLNWLF